MEDRRHLLPLIDISDQIPVLHLPRCRHPRLPWMQVPEEDILEVLTGGGGCSQDLRMMIYKEGKKGRKCQDWNERDFQSVKANEESHILMVFRQLNNGGQSGPINEMGTNEQPTT